MFVGDLLLRPYPVVLSYFAFSTACPLAIVLQPFFLFSLPQLGHPGLISEQWLGHHDTLSFFSFSCFFWPLKIHLGKEEKQKMNEWFLWECLLLVSIHLVCFSPPQSFSECSFNNSHNPFPLEQRVLIYWKVLPTYVSFIPTYSSLMGTNKLCGGDWVGWV